MYVCDKFRTYCTIVSTVQENVHAMYGCPSLLSIMASCALHAITCDWEGRGEKSPKQATAHERHMNVLKLCFYYLGMLCYIVVFSSFVRALTWWLSELMGVSKSKWTPLGQAVGGQLWPVMTATSMLGDPWVVCVAALVLSYPLSSHHLFLSSPFPDKKGKGWHANSSGWTR